MFHQALSFSPGALSLLDVRMSGSRLARASPDLLPGPLRCCLTDGGLAVAGSESGALQMWDVALMTGGTSSYSNITAAARGKQQCFSNTAALSNMAPLPDGLYAPWSLAPDVPINGIAVHGEQDNRPLQLAFALDNGSVALISPL